MKNFVLILFASLTLIACSSDDDNESIEYSETVGYLTNLTSVNYGIQYLWWSITNANSYQKYGSDGIQYSGTSSDNLSIKVKYEIFKDGERYILRRYNEIGDVTGTGTYTDLTITKLDEEYFYFMYNGEETKFRKVTE